MKIGIDAISAVGHSGNSTYTRELTKELVHVGASANTFYLFSFLHDYFRKTSFTSLLGTQVKEVPAYVSRTLLPISRIGNLNDFLLRTQARMSGVEVFHFTNPINFTQGDYKSVVTVHDLAAFHDTLWSKAELQGAYAKKLTQIAERASALIAVSEYTKKDIVEHLRVLPDKITVIYEAVSKDFYPDIDPAYVERALGVKKYVLYAGQLQPRKNALNLLKAWSIVGKKFPEYKLVLVGMVRDSEYHAALTEAIKQGDIAGSVVFAGSVTNEVLRKLYSNARCFAYPSFFEGFGLPLLEAMQCGTPVITSNTSSLPEVVGEAGLLVDPTKPEDIAEALERVLSDDALHKDLASRAILQAKKFSWQKAAEQTLAVYKKVV